MAVFQRFLSGGLEQGIVSELFARFSRFHSRFHVELSRDTAGPTVHGTLAMKGTRVGYLSSLKYFESIGVVSSRCQIGYFAPSQLHETSHVSPVSFDQEIRGPKDVSPSSLVQPKS